jgi:hypothetical protein
LPLAVAVLVISVWKVPESREKDHRGGSDWLGAALATIGLGGVVYGLIESPRLGFSNPIVLLTLIGGVSRWLLSFSTKLARRIRWCLCVCSAVETFRARTF